MADEAEVILPVRGGQNVAVRRNFGTGALFVWRIPIYTLVRSQLVHHDVI